jgi:hypothetical protein
MSDGFDLILTCDIRRDGDRTATGGFAFAPHLVERNGVARGDDHEGIGRGKLDRGGATDALEAPVNTITMPSRVRFMFPESANQRPRVLRALPTGSDDGRP